MLVMYSAVSSGLRLRKLHASSSERTNSTISTAALTFVGYYVSRTLQSIDCPRFELLKRDLRRRRQRIVVEPMVIVLLLKLCFCKLFLLVVDICAPLRVDSRIIVFDHGALLFRGCSIDVPTWACTSGFTENATRGA